MKIIPILSLIALIMFSFRGINDLEQERWVAPVAADSLVNPYLIEPLTLPQGQEVFVIHCAPCHGTRGKGDGIAAKDLKIKPVPFQNKRVMEQSNGALFWKIREGRGEMPSFRSSISEEQKWQMVEYIRDISKPFDQQQNPFKGH